MRRIERHEMREHDPGHDPEPRYAEVVREEEVVDPYLEQRGYREARSYPWGWYYQDLGSELILLLFGAIEALLGLRVLLLLLGANPASPFAALIYNLSWPLAWPFRGLVPDAAQGASLLEVSTLIGMVVYLIAGFLLAWLLDLLADSWLRRHGDRVYQEWSAVERPRLVRRRR